MNLIRFTTVTGNSCYINMDKIAFIVESPLHNTTHIHFSGDRNDYITVKQNLEEAFLAFTDVHKT